MSKKHKKHHKSDKDVEEKPGLKLVLKVGTPDQGENTPPGEDHDPERKHRHKKKKKKHKHHRDERPENQEKPEKRKLEKVEAVEVSDIEDEEILEPPAKRPALDPNVNLTGRSLRERRNIEEEQTPLQHCLEYLHKLLVRKDPNGFFAFPVTDNIAPSYSKIISHPMDLSTMKEKIDDNEYKTLLDYKADFKLMCDNCMTYNHPETIYYKEAEKMLKAGLKLLSKEKMLALKRNLPFLSLVSDLDLGIDQDQPLGLNDLCSTPKSHLSKPKIKKAIMSKFEAFADRLTPEQILAQAQDAAKDAAEQLNLKKPYTKYGFLRRKEDGTTTLNMLNPENTGIVSEKERIVNLGTLLGKVQNGTGSLAGFKEDKRNKALPVNYLNYGPYSSFAPVYDSSQANLTKEDSDLLLTAYGDEAGTQYAYSLCHFVKDSGDYAVRMVDNLLDIITGGDHSKAKPILERVEEVEREDIPDEPEVKDEAVEMLELKSEQQVQEIDFDSLKSLKDLGIDVSFIDDLERDIKHVDELQMKLDSTSELLKDLQQTQYDRLSQTLPTHLAHLPTPDDKEHQLAEKVTEGLSDLVKQVPPSQLLSTSVVRGALGMSEESQSAEQDSEEGLTVAAADTTTNDIGDETMEANDDDDDDDDEDDEANDDYSHPRDDFQGGSENAFSDMNDSMDSVSNMTDSRHGDDYSMIS